MMFFRKLLILPLFAAAAVLHGAPPHLGFLLPSGGQQGTTVDVVIGGQGLWSAGAVVTGPGVTVEKLRVISGFPNVSGDQFRFLRSWIQACAAGNRERPEYYGDTTSWRYHPFFDRIDQLTPLETDLLVTDLLLPRNPLQMSPAINQRAVVRLRIAPDAPAGRREFRLKSSGRISNPMPFYVGDAPEFQEPAPSFTRKSGELQTIRVPGTVNGQIMPGEVDRYLFAARGGEEYTFGLRGRELTPFMGDCVPGHFQPILELQDLSGKRLALADDHYFDPDPRLTFRIPRDGTYRLVVRDALYRGRADFVYRVEIRRGIKEFQLLPLPERIASLPKGGPEYREKVLPFPRLISGVFSRRAQLDRYFVKLKKGEKIAVETFARRLGSPADTVLEIRDEKGKSLAWNDDYKNFGTNRPAAPLAGEEKCIANSSSFGTFLVGTTLHQSDSFLSFTAPRDGTYQILLRESARNCGKDYRYCLRVDRMRPGFRVFYSPSGWEVPILCTLPVHVIVERFDGFLGEIRLTGLPEKFRWVGCDAIPPDAAASWLTISAESGGRKQGEPVTFRLTAVSGALKVPAVPCDEAMQAFAYTHLIPAEMLWATRTWRTTGMQVLYPAENRPVSLSPGGRAEFLLRRGSRMPADAEVKFELTDPPAGLTVTGVPEGKDWKLLFSASPQYKGKEFNQLIQVVYSWSAKNRENKTVRNSSRFLLPVLRFQPVRAK